MLEVLEKAEARELIKRFTIDEYYRLTEGQSTELIQGVIFNKMPKTPLHANIITRLLEFLLPVLPATLSIRSENPLRLGDSEPEPDLAIVSALQSIHDPHPTSAWLVIEVSVTTRSLDAAKADVYAAGGIPVYWNILPEEQITIVHSGPRGIYTNNQVVSFSDSLRLSLPGQSLEVCLVDVLR